MSTAQALPTKIGSDKGIGDIFLADVRRGDETARIVVYASSLQASWSLLQTFAEIYGFTVVRVQ